MCPRRSPRFSILSKTPLESATVSLGTEKYAARIVGDENEPSAIFEVSARAWAHAVVTGTHAVVDAHGPKGASSSIVIAPYAIAETMRDGEE